jgi:hypothetical protein
MQTVPDGRMYEWMIRCIVYSSRFFSTEGTGGVDGQVIYGVLLGIVFKEVANHGIHGETVFAKNILCGKQLSANGARCSGRGHTVNILPLYYFLVSV